MCDRFPLFLVFLKSLGFFFSVHDIGGRLRRAFHAQQAFNHRSFFFIENRSFRIYRAANARICICCACAVQEGRVIAGVGLLAGFAISVFTEYVLARGVFGALLLRAGRAGRWRALAPGLSCPAGV